jgi:hypothetical protein
MQFRICLCCGEPMAAKGKGLSRNPNVCFSCSSMIDGEAEPVDYESSPSSAVESAAFVKPEEVCQAA